MAAPPFAPDGYCTFHGKPRFKTYPSGCVADHHDICWLAHLDQLLAGVELPRGEELDIVLEALRLADPVATEIGRQGRNEGPSILLDAYEGGLSPLELPAYVLMLTMRMLVADTWCDAEWPESHFDYGEWINLFSEAAYPAPTHPITIYRGAVPARRNGMSWTTDLAVAQFFANRFALLVGRPGYEAASVYEATVEPAAVLCMVDDACRLGGRHESEIVIDPDALEDVRRIATAEGGPDARSRLQNRSVASR